jgi:hypothetical protein
MFFIVVRFVALVFSQDFPEGHLIAQFHRNENRFRKKQAISLPESQPPPAKPDDRRLPATAKGPERNFGYAGSSLYNRQQDCFSEKQVIFQDPLPVRVIFFRLVFRYIERVHAGFEMHILRWPC